MIYWCWSANSSGGKLTILTMRLAHHFAVWDFAFSISEPSRSRGHAADQIHQETLEKNHHHHHYYSLVIFYIYPAWTLSCVCVHCVMCDVGCGGQIKSLFKRCCVLVFPPSLMTTTRRSKGLLFSTEKKIYFYLWWWWWHDRSQISQNSVVTLEQSFTKRRRRHVTSFEIVSLFPTELFHFCEIRNWKCSILGNVITL